MSQIIVDLLLGQECLVICTVGQAYSETTSAFIEGTRVDTDVHSVIGHEVYMSQSGRKFWAGHPRGHPAKNFSQALKILEKQAFWHGHPARRSMKNFGLQNFGLICRSLIIAKVVPKCRLNITTGRMADSHSFTDTFCLSEYPCNRKTYTHLFVF